MALAKKISALAVLGLLMARAAVGAEDAPPEQPRTVVVNVVAMTTFASGKAGGSCKKVRVTAGRSDDGRARVGFFETQVGATGSQWRSAGWMAAVTAATLTDFDPRTTRVSYEYEGLIDGPSAGGVLTIGLLAAVHGDQVRPDAAMTGTINPDGSIGTVGGISHKIDGAAAAGMKLLLIPAGTRFGRDQNTGEQVDLVDYGQQKGIEVRGVFDVYEAYRELTGAELPRSAPAIRPRISLAVEKRTRDMTKAWAERYQHAIKSYTVLPGNDKYSEEVDKLYRQGIDYIKQSDALSAEGEFSGAMWDCVMASALSYLALETARCRYTYATRGYDGVVARLRDNQWLADEVDRTMKRMRRETPRTLDQLSVYLITCDAFLEGLSLQLIAKALLANMPDDESEEALALAAEAAGNQILAWLDMKLVGDYLDMQDAYQGTAIPQNAPWREASDYLHHAARANLAVFESIIVEPKAKSRSVAIEKMRDQMLLEDKGYSIVRVADEAIYPNLQRFFGDGDALGYAHLAVSIYTHTRTAGLLAKHYSLGAELDDASYVVNISQERTLADWLTYAEDQSRRNIALLQASGVDATACAQMHAIARIKSRRDLSQKLEGLAEYWSADMHARVLRLLSGLAQGSTAPPPEEVNADDRARSAAQPADEAPAGDE